MHGILQARILEWVATPSPGVREVKCFQIKVPFLEEGGCMRGGADGVLREERGSGLATRKSKFPSVI